MDQEDRELYEVQQYRFVSLMEAIEDCQANLKSALADTRGYKGPGRLEERAQRYARQQRNKFLKEALVSCEKQAKNAFNQLVESVTRLEIVYDEPDEVEDANEKISLAIEDLGKVERDVERMRGLVPK